ncbi:MAG: outer membrane protein assembly factor BamB [Gammaproteobacteria bacterium]|nr:outer membrane protein assembly factor BamB [Gammaproteobacteria bacterium]
MRFVSIATVFLILIGCGSSPSAVLPPVELTTLKNQIKISHQWKFTAGEGVSDFYLKLKPVFYKNTGYIIDYKGHLQAFIINSGKVLWKADLNVPASGGLTFANGKLFLGTSKGEVIALDILKSGVKVLWQKQLSSEILSRPAIAKGILVAKTIDGRVYGLNVADGNQSWVYDRSVPHLTLRGNSSPLINNDIVITASDSGKLAALTLNDGRLLWETTISVAKGRNQLERIIDMDVDPVVVDDVIYVAGYQGRIAAVKLDSGQLIWSRDFSSYSGLYVDAYRVYVTDAQGQVWALNRYNGSTLWRQNKLLRRQLTAPEAHDNYVVVGDYDGYIHWLNREDGKLIARKRINTSDIVIEDEESDKELDLLFSKWNNVLVRPVLINGLLLALDRVGHFEAFQIEKSN